MKLKSKLVLAMIIVGIILMLLGTNVEDYTYEILAVLAFVAAVVLYLFGDDILQTKKTKKTKAVAQEVKKNGPV
jgi:sulfite exporter TauE/SafE